MSRAPHPGLARLFALGGAPARAVARLAAGFAPLSALARELDGPDGLELLSDRWLQPLTREIDLAELFARALPAAGGAGTAGTTGMAPAAAAGGGLAGEPAAHREPRPEPRRTVAAAASAGTGRGTGPATSRERRPGPRRPEEAAARAAAARWGAAPGSAALPEPGGSAGARRPAGRGRVQPAVPERERIAAALARYAAQSSSLARAAGKRRGGLPEVADGGSAASAEPGAAAAAGPGAAGAGVDAASAGSAAARVHAASAGAVAASGGSMDAAGRGAPAATLARGSRRFAGSGASGIAGAAGSHAGVEGGRERWVGGASVAAGILGVSRTAGAARPSPAEALAALHARAERAGALAAADTRLAVREVAPEVAALLASAARAGTSGGGGRALGDPPAVSSAWPRSPEASPRTAAPSPASRELPWPPSREFAWPPAAPGSPAAPSSPAAPPSPAPDARGFRHAGATAGPAAASAPAQLARALDLLDARRRRGAAPSGAGDGRVASLDGVPAGSGAGPAAWLPAPGAEREDEGAGLHGPAAPGAAFSPAPRGLRRLAALAAGAETWQRRLAAGGDPTPLPADERPAASPPGAAGERLMEAELGRRIGRLLRREAERQGIDLTGVME
jgi:hypothetical protein